MLFLLSAYPAGAVVIATATGTENTAAPVDDLMTPHPEDPGWANVGFSSNGLTVVYLGDGWVISAAHVAFVGNVVFDGALAIEPVVGSRVVIPHLPIAATEADLAVWRLVSDPGLPPLVRSTSPPPDAGPGSEILLIGNGRVRGLATSYLGKAGWFTLCCSTKRWGTNRIDLAPFDVGPVLGRHTRSFEVSFSVTDPPGPATTTPFESAAVIGDSGGAVFYLNGSVWELTGIMHAVGRYAGQPSFTVVDGNPSYVSDLSFYGPQIDAEVATLACGDGSIDDDGDGLLDYPDDPGCSSASDPFETDATLPCDDGIDNDGDGLRDMLDPGCADPLSPQEDPACDDGLDNDGDGLTDFSGGDPGCTSAGDGSEKELGLRCDDGLDNDGDGRIDFDPVTYASPGNASTPPAGVGDPGCSSPSGFLEVPGCQDGIDNDGDGGIDYDAGLSANGFPHPSGSDPQCWAPHLFLERPLSGPSCGMGFELVVLVPLLARLRRRRRSA